MADPADELITYFDDATGERTGLTADEVGRWVAATASLLTHECRLAPGDRVAVLLPPHWQTAAVLLGAWSAGIAVSFRGWATAGLAAAGDPLEATFVERRRVGNWLDEVPAGKHQFVLDLAAPGEHRSAMPDQHQSAPGSTVSDQHRHRPAPDLGAPRRPYFTLGQETSAEHPEPSLAAAGDVPDGYRDYAMAIRPHWGAAPPEAAIDAHGAAAVDGTTYGEYASVASEVARMRGIGRGDRVLVDAATQEQPLLWLLAPLSVGASIVICANLDRTLLDDRVAAEGVTRIL